VLPAGDERAITVIVDLAHPLAADRSATLRVDVEGAYHFMASMNAGRIRLTSGN